jgi:Protein of unknown function (DUF551)
MNFKEKNKWILCEIQMPEEAEEVIVISLDDNEFPTATYPWSGCYINNKFYVTAFDSENVFELTLKPICWIPLPKSPFKDLEED